MKMFGPRQNVHMLFLLFNPVVDIRRLMIFFKKILAHLITYSLLVLFYFVLAMQIIVHAIWKLTHVKPSSAEAGFFLLN